MVCSSLAHLDLVSGQRILLVRQFDILRIKRPKEYKTRPESFSPATTKKVLSLLLQPPDPGGSQKQHNSRHCFYLPASHSSRWYLGTLHSWKHHIVAARTSLSWTYLERFFSHIASHISLMVLSIPSPTGWQYYQGESYEKEPVWKSKNESDRTKDQFRPCAVLEHHRFVPAVSLGHKPPWPVRIYLNQARGPSLWQYNIDLHQPKICFKFLLGVFCGLVMIWQTVMRWLPA